MLMRALLTTAFAGVGFAAALIVDCTSSIIDLFKDDLSSLCTTVGFLGHVIGSWTGFALGAFAALGLLATWVPYVRARLRERRFEPTKAFADNLPRLADVGTQLTEVENVPTLAEIQFTRLMRKVEAVEVSVLSDTVSTREVTRQWMGLLREANELHNKGKLETNDFKKVNTRLLDLFFVPKEETGGYSGAASH